MNLTGDALCVLWLQLSNISLIGVVLVDGVWVGEEREWLGL